MHFKGPCPHKKDHVIGQTLANLRFPFSTENWLLKMQLSIACYWCLMRGEKQMKKAVPLLGWSAWSLHNRSVPCLDMGPCHSVAEVPKEEQVLCLVLVLSSLEIALQCRTNWESLQIWQRLLMGLQRARNKGAGTAPPGGLKLPLIYFC